MGCCWGARSYPDHDVQCSNADVTFTNADATDAHADLQALIDMYDIDALATHDADAPVRCAQCNVLRDRVKRMTVASERY